MSKINNVIGLEVRRRLMDIEDIKRDSDESVKRSLEAKENADEAKHRSDITKKQLDEALKDGDQVYEVQTLRVDPVTGEVYDTAGDRFEANQKTFLSKINNTEMDLTNRSINVKIPFGTNLIPAKGDGITDDIEALQAIIDYAKSKNIPIFLPTGKYLISNTITLYRSSVLFGTLNSVWGGSGGVEVVSNIEDGAPAISFSDPSVVIKDIAIRGTMGCNGIKAEDGAYDFSFENVKVKGCRINFDIGNTWTYTLSKCRTEGGEIGFDIKGATSATLMSCVAFNADIGFRVTELTYTNFVACGADGCFVGLDIYDVARGVTFSSFGVENAKDACLNINGNNIAVTFTSLNLGNHSDVDLNMIQVDGATVTFTDFKLSQQMSPKSPGKILDIKSGDVTLINPALSNARIGDIEKCTVIGGSDFDSKSPLYHNRLQKPLEVPLLQTHSGKTPEIDSHDMSSILFKLEPNQTYLCTASTAGGGPQNCQQIIITDGVNDHRQVLDITPKNYVTFDVTNVNVRLKNLSENNKAYDWSVTRLR